MVVMEDLRMSTALHCLNNAVFSATKSNIGRQTSLIRPQSTSAKSICLAIVFKCLLLQDVG